MYKIINLEINIFIIKLNMFIIILDYIKYKFEFLLGLIDKNYNKWIL